MGEANETQGQSGRVLRDLAVAQLWHQNPAHSDPITQGWPVSFLLDTNVISDSIKPRPNPRLTAWLAGVEEEDVFLSVITLTEIRYGIERMAEGRRRRQLDSWLQQDLVTRFENRMLAIDTVIADACGRLVARSLSLGHPLEFRDAFIAATAEVYELTLVTRNTSDFQPVLGTIFNPWSAN
jgi:predicted nucleic acid-binding protein